MSELFHEVRAFLNRAYLDPLSYFDGPHFHHGYFRYRTLNRNAQEMIFQETYTGNQCAIFFKESEHHRLSYLGEIEDARFILEYFYMFENRQSRAVGKHVA